MKSLLDVKISQKELREFESLLSNSMGLNYTESKQNELKSKLIQTVNTFGFKDVGSCLNFLTKTPLTKKHIVSLAKDLTIGETYFFRHLPSIKALETHILPTLIEKKREQGKKLNIWSAACSSGEEPYTIAILLHRLLPDLQDWDITIIGTDINQAFLERAEKAVYKEWSFRGTPMPMKKRFFRKNGDNRYQLIPEIKEMVDFEYFNLVEDNPSALLKNAFQFDLILCANVLIYFTPQHIVKVIRKLSDALVEKGWLLVSMVEVPYVEEERLHSKEVGKILAFEKNLLPHPATFKPQKKPQKKPPKKPPKAVANKPIRKPLEVVKHRSLNELQTLLLNREYGEVIETLEMAPPLSSDTEMIALLIKAYANQGNLIQAKAWCEKGLQGSMVDPTLHYLYAIVLQELDCTEDSIESLKKALFLDPQFAIVHFTLGTLMVQKGRIKEGEKYFRNTLDLLENKEPNQVLAGTDDLTVERLQCIVEALLPEEKKDE